MANDGKLHASLANLQSLPDNIADVRLRKAKVYRLLGRSEAEPLYRSLLGSCLAAEAEHGLGQLAAAKVRLRPGAGASATRRASGAHRRKNP